MRRENRRKMLGMAGVATLIVTATFMARATGVMASDVGVDPAGTAPAGTETASSPAGDWQCALPPHGGGGTVPTPVIGTNQHVELAPGEFYSLYGTVVAMSVAGAGQPASADNTAPFLEVDLNQHPWLAGSARSKNPYYPLLGGWDYWSRYLQKRVLTAVQAQALVINKTPQPEVVIVLRPINTTVVSPVGLAAAK